MRNNDIENLTSRIGRANALLKTLGFLQKSALITSLLGAVAYVLLTTAFPYLRMSEESLQALMVFIVIFLVFTVSKNRVKETANHLALRLVETEIKNFRHGIANPS